MNETLVSDDHGVRKPMVDKEAKDNQIKSQEKSPGNNDLMSAES